jgi:hypothetical protein
VVQSGAGGGTNKTEEIGLWYCLESVHCSIAVVDTAAASVDEFVPCFGSSPVTSVCSVPRHVEACCSNGDHGLPTIENDLSHIGHCANFELDFVADFGVTGVTLLLRLRCSTVAIILERFVAGVAKMPLRSSPTRSVTLSLL